MPVHDHEVHESVKVEVDAPYGCQNSQAKAFYYALCRDYQADGRFTVSLKKIENAMSKLCRYDKRKEDARCLGCQKPSDTEYLESYGL